MFNHLSPNHIKFLFYVLVEASLANSVDLELVYCKVLETKGIYILNDLVLLLFENL